MELFLGAANTKGAWCCTASIQDTAPTRLESLSLIVRSHCSCFAPVLDESCLLLLFHTPNAVAYADPDWFFDLDEEQRAVLQQPASRGRGDIMASDQMKGAAKL